MKNPPNRPMRHLARIRHERRITQLQLARQISRSRALISLYERGYVPRDDGDVAALAVALGVTREILLAPVIELRAGGGFVVIREESSLDSSASRNRLSKGVKHARLSAP